MIHRIFSNKLIRSFVIFTVLATLLMPSFSGCSSGPSNTFAKLLGLVPAGEAAEDQPVNITLINYALAFEEIGISFTSFEDLMDKIRADSRNLVLLLPQAEGSDITGWGRYAEHSTIQKEYVGYNLADADAEIQFGTYPNNGVAAIGNYDPGATKNALSNQDEWLQEIRDRYQTEDYNGVTIHSWGDGFKMSLELRLTPPHVDFLGRARPLAITDNHLFYGPSVDLVKQMIDASQQKDKSLADLPAYISIANILAGFKVNSAIIGNAAAANQFLSSLEKESIPEKEKIILRNSIGTPLKRFLTFATAPAKDETGNYTLIVMYHESPELARENVSLLKQRLENDTSIFFHGKWADLFTKTDISANGNVLIAKLYRESRSFWASWIYSEDNLLYHEE